MTLKNESSCVRLNFGGRFASYTAFFSYFYCLFVVLLLSFLTLTSGLLLLVGKWNLLVEHVEVQVFKSRCFCNEGNDVQYIPCNHSLSLSLLKLFRPIEV